MMLSKMQHSPLFALKRSFVFCNRGPNQNLPRMQDISPMFAVKMKFPIPVEHPCLFLISLTYGFLSQFRFQKCKTSITIPVANSSLTLMLQIYRFTHSITQPNTTHPITKTSAPSLGDSELKVDLIEQSINIATGETS